MALTDEVMNILGLGGGAGGFGINTVITLVVFLIIMLAFVVFIVYYITIRAKYRYTILIYEKVNGQYRRTGRDKARELNLSRGGDIAFYLLKRKKTLPFPTIQTGERTYMYAIRDDGEWINFGLEDINEKSRTLGVHFLDKEMRYARTQLQRNLKERFEDNSFLKQYGGLMMYTILITITGIMIWLLFREWLTLANIINDAMTTANDVMELQRQILGGVDNIRSGGSGLQPA